MLCYVAKNSPSTDVARMAGMGIWNILLQSKDARFSFMQVRELRGPPSHTVEAWLHGA